MTSNKNNSEHFFAPHLTFLLCAILSCAFVLIGCSSEELSQANPTFGSKSTAQSGSSDLETDEGKQVSQTSDESDTIQRTVTAFSSDSTTLLDHVAASQELNQNPFSAQIPLNSEHAAAQSKLFTEAAVDSIRSGDTNSALEQLQKALLLDKGNIEATFRVMSILDDRGQQEIRSGRLKSGYENLILAGVFARELARKHAATLLPEKEQAWVANALYNEACGQCFLGRKQLALEALTLAFEAGFDRPELLKQDSDLDLIRSLPAFKQLENQYCASN